MCTVSRDDLNVLLGEFEGFVSELHERSFENIQELLRHLLQYLEVSSLGSIYRFEFHH
jgi:hypothetical protein